MKPMTAPRRKAEKVRRRKCRFAFAALAALPALSCAASAVVRTKADMRLWQTVHDRAAPLEWAWYGGADSATLIFSNRLARVVASVSVARAEGEARGGVPGPAPSGGESVVDVTLVQTAGGAEVARETATLAYVGGAGGGPVVVRVPGTRDWSRPSCPQVFAFDPAWLGEEGESGYGVYWPPPGNLRIFFR